MKLGLSGPFFIFHVFRFSSPSSLVGGRQRESRFSFERFSGGKYQTVAHTQGNMARGVVGDKWSLRILWLCAFGSAAGLYMVAVERQAQNRQWAIQEGLQATEGDKTPGDEASSGHGNSSLLRLLPLSLSPTVIYSHIAMATVTKFSGTVLSTFSAGRGRGSSRFLYGVSTQKFWAVSPSSASGQLSKAPRRIVCEAAEVSVMEEGKPASGDGKNWVPVVPLAALPRGERRVIIQDGETILLLWYKDAVFAVENRSPAEGAYSEGLLNAKLTQDGCIVCPTTDSTFDLKTGTIKDWYPKNPVLRALTPPLRKLYVYPVKTDEENIYISLAGGTSLGASAEIVFSGKAQPGVTSSDVNVDEVRMVVDEDLEGFGFSEKNELINGKAAVIGFLLLLDFELLTGKGILKGTGFLDFLYAASRAFSSS
ncbi:hypothetical protein H6P81_001897 [Aristolochia fimbriata]|uniref:Rieske domain-containing protein n=1 Tax=Aristolochia fimbriata TaxID=158543 RepID=A0AAV7F9W9_ARIFI|nr:hypothetical protein H6P81_001897 [Aristolochia fimbriata]